MAGAGAAAGKKPPFGGPGATRGRATQGAQVENHRGCGWIPVLKQWHDCIK